MYIIEILRNIKVNIEKYKGYDQEISRFRSRNVLKNFMMNIVIVSSHPSLQF